MYKDYQRASQLFSAVEALADFDAYDGYSVGILNKRGNFDASRVINIFQTTKFICAILILEGQQIEHLTF